MRCPTQTPLPIKHNPLTTTQNPLHAIHQAPLTPGHTLLQMPNTNLSRQEDRRMQISRTGVRSLPLLVCTHTNFHVNR